jgi:hypothetical protein
LKVRFVEKSLDTPWKPIPGTNNIINLFKGREPSSYIYGEKYSKEYASTFFDLKGTLIQERKVEFMNYLNKYRWAY